MTIQELLSTYEKKKESIRKRLEEFKQIWNGSEEKLFYELCYCIMTANGSAEAALAAQKRLEEKNTWKSGDVGDSLSNVRYGPKKAQYILHNRKNMLQDGISVKKPLEGSSIFDVRERIVKDSKYFKGLSYKEVSHFLRNIGIGEELAILDRHILRVLKELGVIEEVPATLTRNKYLEIEKKMQGFSKKIGIPMGELDLLIWSELSGTDISKAK